jgi:ParB/RepB/Spo0J family partition protein
MSSATATEAPAGLVDLLLAEIKPSKTNPRRSLNGPAMDELVVSVKSHGVLQPFLVRPNGKGYELVAGHRRFEAANKAGLERIPAAVRQLSDNEALEIQVIENLQRQDLHPLEEAEGYRQLVTLHKYDAARIAERVGRSVKYVYDRIKLTQLTKSAKQLFLDGRITAGHAILLARLDAKAQDRALDPEEDGVWRNETTLWDDEDDGRREKDPHAGLTTRSVRELDGWIAKHVRFDPKAPDPMLFPETAATLGQAQEKGRKVIPITHDHYIQEEARDGRTWGPRSWKRADGEIYEDDRLRKVKSKTCEYSVTGFVAVGPGRGEAFQVCVNKDKCTVHWGAEIARRKKRVKAAGDKAVAKGKDRYEAERLAREAKDELEKKERARFEKALPTILQAIADRVKKSSAHRGGVLCNLVMGECSPRFGGPSKAAAYVPLGSHPEDVVRAAAFQIIHQQSQTWVAFREFHKLAGKFNVDVKKIVNEVAPVAKAVKLGSGTTRAKARKKK